MRAYDLFRRKTPCGVFCAVPAGGDVPSFVLGPAWAFDSRLEDDENELIGFDTRAAAMGVLLNGFYLFEVFGRR